MTTPAGEAARAPARSSVAGLIYAALLASGIGLFFLIRWYGEGLVAPAAPANSAPVSTHRPGQVDVILHLLAILVALIALGGLLGAACRWIGQPPVIGEIVAGIALGPSLLGAIWPEAMYALVPSITTDPHRHVMAALQAVAQLGVILFMFLVGLELNAARIKQQARAAIAISHASILLPFVLGAALALVLYPRLSHEGIPFTSFALFMGVAMSITAFPVLARILTDRGIQRTEMGQIALACAAADDVTAWWLLALVVGVAQAQVAGAMAVGLGALAFVVTMLVVVRPLAVAFTRHYEDKESLSPTAVAALFVAVLLAAFATEAIGVHAVFGAFLLGAVIPADSRLAREFTTRLHDPVTILLLPAFFAATGMRTEIGLVSGGENWVICIAIILIATLGKFGGTFVAARVVGQPPRMAAALGILMNTRGLMELIVLNIGLDLGVISPTLFAMMVIMALVTTFATTPILQRLAPAK
jgi:Kef-type K+ transport system membrane component KefB